MMNPQQELSSRGFAVQDNSIRERMEKKTLLCDVLQLSSGKRGVISMTQAPTGTR